MKKQSVASKVLHLLNTKGGMKPKALIVATKAKPASVYNALNTLSKRKMIAKEEDGVYISQTQTSVSKSTNKRGYKSPMSSGTKENLLKENQQLTEWTVLWKRRYDKLEQDYTQAKVMYLDSQAVVKYLETKIEELLRG